MTVEISIAFGLFALAGLFAYIAINFKENHGIFQMLFTAVSLMCVLVGENALVEFAENSGELWATNVSTTIETLYYITIITFLITIMYFLFNIIYTAVFNLSGQSEKPGK